MPRGARRRAPAGATLTPVSTFPFAACHAQGAPRRSTAASRTLQHALHHLDELETAPVVVLSAVVLVLALISSLSTFEGKIVAEVAFACLFFIAASISVYKSSGDDRKADQTEAGAQQPPPVSDEPADSSSDVDLLQDPVAAAKDIIHKYEDQGTHMDDIGSDTEAFTQKDVVRKPTGMGEDKPSSTD